MSRAALGARALDAREGVREARVREVVGLMARGEWSTGSTRAAADRWGCPTATASAVVAEAQRALRLLVGEDREALRAQLLAAIDSVRERARTRTQRVARVEFGPDPVTGQVGPHEVTEEPDPDLRVELEALRLWGHFAGLDPRQQVEVGRAGEFDRMSDDELRAYAEGRALLAEGEEAGEPDG